MRSLSSSRIGDILVQTVLRGSVNGLSPPSTIIVTGLAPSTRLLHFLCPLHLLPQFLPRVDCSQALKIRWTTFLITCPYHLSLAQHLPDVLHSRHSSHLIAQMFLHWYSHCLPSTSLFTFVPYLLTVSRFPRLRPIQHRWLHYGIYKSSPFSILGIHSFLSHTTIVNSRQFLYAASNLHFTSSCLR